MLQNVHLQGSGPAAARRTAGAAACAPARLRFHQQPLHVKQNQKENNIEHEMETFCTFKLAVCGTVCRFIPMYDMLLQLQPPSYTGAR